MANKNFWIEREIVNSKAFNSLQGVAPQLLLKILYRRQWQPPKKGKKEWENWNNGFIRVRYTEAETWGWSEYRFGKAIDDLAAKGFVSVHPNTDQTSHANLFTLLPNWRRFGENGFEPGERMKQSAPFVWTDKTQNPIRNYRRRKVQRPAGEKSSGQDQKDSSAAGGKSRGQDS